MHILSHRVNDMSFHSRSSASLLGVTATTSGRESGQKVETHPLQLSAWGRKTMKEFSWNFSREVKFSLPEYLIKAVAVERLIDNKRLAASVTNCTLKIEREKASFRRFSPADSMTTFLFYSFCGIQAPSQNIVTQKYIIPFFNIFFFSLLLLTMVDDNDNYDVNA